MLQVVDGTYESWHAAARVLLDMEIEPQRAQWSDTRAAQLPLDAGPAAPPKVNAPREHRKWHVPRAFVARATLGACHRNPQRWALLYRILWRLTHGERALLDNPLDDDAMQLDAMVRDVRRDEHKMHAFVRFRKVADPDGDRYVAFHRPDHFIVRLAARFFVERFQAMRWSILTPDECVHWDGQALTYSPGVDGSSAPKDDALEDVWRTYYAAIFNPARVNTRAMVRELPVRHWATLPEAQLIPALVSQASGRVQQMITKPSAATSARMFVPPSASTIDELAAAATGCRGCPLFADATQTVFGAGPQSARLMLVGEQPGDEEDVTGQPFVGPAGGVLDDALSQAGLSRASIYVTNAVKHFTFRREGKRRIHERPRMSDVRACRPWLEAEIDRVRPAVIVCLGSTAAQALLGPRVRIQRDRGLPVPSPWAPHVIPTYHPSAVLRADAPRHAEELFAWLVQDLRRAGELA